MDLSLYTTIKRNENMNVLSLREELVELHFLASEKERCVIFSREPYVATLRKGALILQVIPDFGKWHPRQGDCGITKLSRSRIRRIKMRTFRANRLKGSATFHEFHDEPSSPRGISFRCHSKNEVVPRVGELVLNHEKNRKKKRER